MSRIRWAVLVAALLLASCRQQDPPAEAPEVLLAQACRYLWNQQAADGGWHSSTHALVQSGQAWTPFILHTLLAVPGTVFAAPSHRVAAARAFIRAHVDETGALGLADPDVLEYPNYATAYGLRALVRAGDPADAPLVARMRQYLLRQQLNEARGLPPDHVAYGGWGFGETNLPPGQAGHADLSHTRRVLQALREGGHTGTDAYDQARAFLRIVQKHPADVRQIPGGTAPAGYDGGFYYSPVVLAANKGGHADQPLSYATATCDGLLALLAAGLTPEDEPVRQARAWLRAHPRLDRPEGIPEDGPGQWDLAMQFYHLAVRAEAYHAVAETGPWRDTLIQQIAGAQQPDGHVVNPYGAPSKEDDPLLATALAVVALTHTLR